MKTLMVVAVLVFLVSVIGCDNGSSIAFRELSGMDSSIALERE